MPRNDGLYDLTKGPDALPRPPGPGEPLGPAVYGDDPPPAESPATSQPQAPQQPRPVLDSDPSPSDVSRQTDTQEQLSRLSEAIDGLTKLIEQMQSRAPDSDRPAQPAVTPFGQTVDDSEAKPLLSQEPIGRGEHRAEERREDPIELKRLLATEIPEAGSERDVTEPKALMDGPYKPPESAEQPEALKKLLATDIPNQREPEPDELKRPTATDVGPKEQPESGKSDDPLKQLHDEAVKHREIATEALRVNEQVRDGIALLIDAVRAIDTNPSVGGM